MPVGRTAFVRRSDQVPDPSLPAISQAEAYHGGRLVLIRNSKTENAVELTSCHPSVTETIYEVPDLPAFLDAIAGPVRGARVIVALGDSRTANFSNWPRILAITHLRNSDAVVVNLADWANCSEDHVVVTEYFLSWLKRHEAKSVSVILFGELIDLHRKLPRYAHFVDSLAPQPFLEREEQLSTHRYGSELAHLHDQIPDDVDGASLWIARRVVAIARLMDKVCVEVNAKFLAVLEPNAYLDNSPGYLAALCRAYEDSGSPDLDFEPWCQQHSYARDPSEHFNQDLRPLLDLLRTLWRAQQQRSSHGMYADLSDLFRTVDGSCFAPVFDAIHYNDLGVSLIANALFQLIRGDGP